MPKDREPPAPPQTKAEAEALVKRHGSITKAAKALGMAERTFRYRLTGRPANPYMAEPSRYGPTVERRQREDTRHGGISKRGLKAPDHIARPTPAAVHGPSHTFTSDAQGRHVFGVVADTHLGSKYERLDVLEDLYTHFAEAGVTTVFHAGNWIDGEARFNKGDIHTHGFEEQLEYMARHYPQRAGITTYAVTGDDHEGWYAQREGIDVGKRAEQVMVAAGHLWVNQGYMEAYSELVDARSGAVAGLLNAHPGGGSSYAESYKPQKIIETYEGGEKPAVAIYGHYHKMAAGETRNVWWVMPGCTKDQDPFARKRGIRYVVGGVILRLTQEPRTGAVMGFAPEMFRYFNKGWYNRRWSHSGSVGLPARTRS